MKDRPSVAEGSWTAADPAYIPESASTTQDVELGDIDGDGDLGVNPNNQLLMNDGSGGLTLTDNALPEDDLRTLDGDFAHLDGDGDLDLVTANSRVTTGLFPGLSGLRKRRCGPV